MPILFRVRLVPLAATVVVVAIGLMLGQWQTRRALEKEAIETKLSARESAPPAVLSAAPAALDTLEYRRVLVKGEFVRGWPLYLDNRPHRGAAGFYVLMPLRIADSDMHVLVARGWIPRSGAERTRVPPLVTPVGPVEILGMVRSRPGQLLQLGRAEDLRPGAIVQNVEAAEFAAASKLAMQPLLVEQLSDTHDGLARDWVRPSTGLEKHRGYAFQWYGLAAAALLFFVITGFRRGTK